MFRLTLASLVCAGLLGSVSAHAATPMEYTKSLVDEFKKLKPEKGLSAEGRKQNEAIQQELDDAFDFQTITTKLMAPRVDKFTPEQQETFRKKFHAVIRAGTFVDTGDFFKKATLEFQDPTVEDGLTTVPIHVTVPAEDTDMVVGLVWKDEGGRLKVVDVLLDGDSLVKDYTNQVARVVDKKGITGLFADLDARERSAKKAKYGAKTAADHGNDAPEKAKPE